MEFLSIHLFKNGSMYITVDIRSSILYHHNAMVDPSILVQSVENPCHNVDVCINSALAKLLRKINTIHCSARVYIILWTVMLGT